MKSGKKKLMKDHDSFHMQQIRQIIAQIPSEALVREGWIELADKIIPVFDTIGIKGTPVFRAMKLKHT